MIKSLGANIIILTTAFLIVYPALLVVLFWEQTVGRAQFWWYWRKPRQKSYCLSPPPGWSIEYEGPKSWPWCKMWRQENQP